MSRVEEALRRASGQGARENGVAPDESSFARYVAERARTAGGQTPTEPPSAVLARNGSRAAAPPAVVAALRGKLVVTPEIEPVSVEQYRRLAAALHEMQTASGLKSLTVSSALPREGKTLTVTNLALTLSESYRRRILLIDADFRRPAIHDLFGIPNEVGLADALRSPGAGLPLVPVSATLSVLPAGRIEDSATAALSSDSLKRVVADVGAAFDWVLLDTPPVGLLTDAQLVARATDGVLFVIAAGVTPCALVQRSLAEIGTDRVVGVVLNRLEERVLPAHNYYEQYSPARP